MGSEAKSPLTAETLEQLRALVRENLDSRDGLKETAGRVAHPPVAKFCRELSEERAAQAGELQAFVARNGGPAKAAAPATLHVLWIEIRTTLVTSDPGAVLFEVERGETALREAYERLLHDSSHATVSDILHRHHAAVKAACDRLLVLRDQHKKA